MIGKIARACWSRSEARARRPPAHRGAGVEPTQGERRAVSKGYRARPFRRVRGPLDGSRLARRALLYALHLVRRAGGELLLLRTTVPLSTQLGRRPGYCGDAHAFREGIGRSSWSVGAHKPGGRAAHVASGPQASGLAGEPPCRCWLRSTVRLTEARPWPQGRGSPGSWEPESACVAGTSATQDGSELAPRSVRGTH